MRFRSEQHLRRAAEIRAVREQGRREDCRAFVLLWKTREPAASISAAPATPAAAPARLCVIASTHAVGGAVRRNRAKRRLREVFRHRQASVPAGCDLVLVARRSANAWPLAELEAKFTAACARLAPPAPTAPAP
jgi:ribonuclease P protein component